jgi:NAD+ diphosphatase
MCVLTGAHPARPRLDLVPDLVAPPYRLGAPLASPDGLDRVAALRSDPDALAAAWAADSTVVVLVHRGRTLVDDNTGLVLVPSREAPPGERYLLGRRPDGSHVFAVATAEPLAGGHDLRSAAPWLSGTDVELLMHAVALANWHDTHPRCSRCGAPTEPVAAGYARMCPQDGSEHYPRTDPAMIVLVLDGGPPGHDRCLLGRQASWRAGRFSTLAGFVEPGESVERAVAREVAEEVGVPVRTVAYAGSQPWPFPASLMLAFYAVAEPGHTTDAAVRPDGLEIVEARWFDRATLRAATADGDVVVPPVLSVARRLIEGWYGRALDGRAAWR